MSPQTLTLLSAFFGASAIIFGAFGAHALKKHFTAELMQSFETGVKYQMYHAILLLVVGLNFGLETSFQQLIVWLFILGILFFSFSIYGLCISSAFGKKLRILGPLTPIGGLLLIAGWISLGSLFF